jgi:hypothetical protein
VIRFTEYPAGIRPAIHAKQQKPAKGSQIKAAERKVMAV